MSSSPLYLWLKVAHLVFMVSWFAGLFYLPRLFVYHVDTHDDAGHQRFCIMEKRLYGLTSIAMIGTLVFGIWLWLKYWWGVPHTGWLHAKIALVVLLIGYQHMLKAHMKRLAQGANKKSAKFFRVLNEVPAVMLVLIVILVIVKPF